MLNSAPARNGPASTQQFMSPHLFLFTERVHWADSVKKVAMSVCLFVCQSVCLSVCLLSLPLFLCFFKRLITRNYKGQLLKTEQLRKDNVLRFTIWLRNGQNLPRGKQCFLVFATHCLWIQVTISCSILLCPVCELAAGRSVAAARGVSDMRQVTCDV